MQQVEMHAAPRIEVRALNDYLLVFYAGRDPSFRSSAEWNWFDDSAMKLGIAMYVIHQGDEAVVYDTFASVTQARWCAAISRRWAFAASPSSTATGTSTTSPAT